jgi:site-specific DNA-methyltransferase (adenine-specific)
MVNKLYYGDNLEVLRKYIKHDQSIFVISIPPFNSKRNYNQIYNNLGKEDQARHKRLWIPGHGIITLTKL